MAEDFSWFFLPVDNAVRKRLIKFVKWRWFERIVILVIISNCIMLALYNPLDRQCHTQLCQVLEKLENFVFAFFVVEMLVKMTALGIWGRRGYLGDKWNILDFLIVITGIVDMSVRHRGSFLTIVRLGRVLRPLRAINRVPSIRILVTLLMDTVPMLANVLILAFLVFSCFGIMGVQMFQGKLRNRCFMSEEDFNKTNNSVAYPAYFLPATSIDFICHLEQDHGTRSCNDVPNKYDYNLCQAHYKMHSIYGNATNTSCLDAHRYYRTCKQEGPNPYYGSISFDNIAMAFVFIYQVVTLEGWSDLMYLIQDAYSFWTWIYFVTLIIIGSFFLVNLALVVITMQFSETKRRETRLMKQQRLMTSSQLSLYSDLRNVWQWLRQCRCFANSFRSVHYIHQHVHLHQRPSYCDQCKSHLNSDEDSTPALKPPNIQISFISDDSPSSPKSEKPQRGRSMSCPDSFPTLVSFPLNVHNNNKQDSDVVSIQNGMIDVPAEHNNIMYPKNKENTPGKNYLTPNHKVRSTSMTSNTISVHAESVSEVKVNRSSCNSIISQTSLSLKINSSNGSFLHTNSYLGTDFTSKSQHASTSTLKSCTRKLSRTSTDDTDFESSGEFCYGSMFDLQNCDKYYVSVEPTSLQKFRSFCKRISESSKASLFIMLVIILNTLCMAVEHHNQPTKMTKILEVLNVVFIWIFTMEMVLKIIGVGLRAYFKLAFNCFDCLIVVLSIVELVIESGSTGNFTVFRSLRLLRIFRLIHPIRHQIAVILRTTSSVMTFFALLFLFMFTFAILGMNIFGGKFAFQNRVGNMVTSRSNFDTFLWAMVTVFQILTQEDWNLVMYDGIRATSTWATLYFISLMTIGYYVLLNLLVAILVEGFTTPLEKRRMARHLESLVRHKSRKAMKRTASMPDISTPNKTGIGAIQLASSCRLENRRRTLGVVNIGHLKNLFATTKGNTGSDLDEDDGILHVECAREKTKKNDPVLLSARSTKHYVDEEETVEWRTDWDDSTLSLDEEFLVKDTRTCHPPQCMIHRKTWSLYIFSEQNRFRCAVAKITESKYFDWFILLLIIYSCVLLALEHPTLDPNGQLRYVIDTSQFVLTWMFLCEMMMKVIAIGFAVGKDSYVHNGWNVLDGILVFASVTELIVTLCFNSSHTLEIIKGVRVLRATRALRPLRMIRKAPGLKLVVQTLLYSLKPIGNTILIAGIFFLVFGILGVQLLKGKFYYCFGIDSEKVSNKTECTQNPKGYWVNHQYNFDNLFEALMALFVVSTKDGWVDIMRRGIDAKGVNLEPQVDYSPWRLVYFISFLLIGGFLVLNMIVGVVVENFQRCQELQSSEEKTKLIIDKWKARLIQNRNTYWHHYTPARKGIYKLCTHTFWDVGIAIIIFTNVFFMALEHYRMSETFHDILETSNLIFTAIYVFEAAILITAFGPKRYFKEKWYCFDMLIVVVSIVGIVLENLDVEKLHVNPAAIKAIRMLRVVRALKLLRVAKGLRFLLDHVADTIPQVTNLGLLFSLLFFVYSCLGIQLFGTLECNNRYPCSGMGRHANFKSLGSSMLTLFRIATGDNWSGILKDTLRSSCDDSIKCKQNCCTSRYISPLFFVSFVLFAQFVLVNIVIAVLMKHLQVPQDKLKKKKVGKESPRRKEHSSKNVSNNEKKNAFSKWHNVVKQKTPCPSDDTVINMEKKEHPKKRLTNTINNRMKNNTRKYSCPDRMKLNSTSNRHLKPNAYLIPKSASPYSDKRILSTLTPRKEFNVIENRHFDVQTINRLNETAQPLLKWQTDLLKSQMKIKHIDGSDNEVINDSIQHSTTVDEKSTDESNLLGEDEAALQSGDSSFTIVTEETHKTENSDVNNSFKDNQSNKLAENKTQLAIQSVSNLKLHPSIENFAIENCQSENSSLCSFIIIAMDDEAEGKAESEL